MTNKLLKTAPMSLALLGILIGFSTTPAHALDNALHQAIIAKQHRNALDLAKHNRYLGLWTNIDLNELDCKGRSALILAVQYDHSELFNYLLDRAVNLDVQDNDGNSALMYAVRAQNPLAVGALIRNGAKVDLFNTDGNTALMWAVKEEWKAPKQNKKVVEALLAGDLSRNYGNYRFVHEFVNHRNIQGNTAVMWAARSGNCSAIETLVKAGANVNLMSEHDRTALMWAAEKGKQDAVLLLVSLQADVNQRSKAGKLASHYAYAAGWHQISRSLNHFEKQAATANTVVTPVAILAEKQPDSVGPRQQVYAQLQEVFGGQQTGQLLPYSFDTQPQGQIQAPSFPQSQVQTSFPTQVPLQQQEGLTSQSQLTVQQELPSTRNSFGGGENAQDQGNWHRAARFNQVAPEGDI